MELVRISAHRHVSSRSFTASFNSCFRSRRVQPFRQYTHRYSDYIINLVRAKALDTTRRGYIPNELAQYVFSTLEIPS